MHIPPVVIRERLLELNNHQFAILVSDVGIDTHLKPRDARSIETRPEISRVVDVKIPVRCVVRMERQSEQAHFTAIAIHSVYDIQEGRCEEISVAIDDANMSSAFDNKQPLIAGVSNSNWSIQSRNIFL